MPQIIIFEAKDTGEKIPLFKSQALLLMPILKDFEDVIRENDKEEDSTIIVPFPIIIFKVAVTISLFQVQRQRAAIKNEEDPWSGIPNTVYKEDEEELGNLTLDGVSELFRLSLFMGNEYLQKITSNHFRKMFSTLNDEQLKKQCDVDTTEKKINVSQMYLYVIKSFGKIFSPDSKQGWYLDPSNTVFQNESYIDSENSDDFATESGEFCNWECERKQIINLRKIEFNNV